MKKTILLTILSLAMLTVQGQKTDTLLSRTIFKLSPQHFAINALKAGIERFNAHRTASMAFFLTGMMENNQKTFTGDGYTGIAGEFQLRKYISPLKRYHSRRNKIFHQGIYGGAYLQGGYYAGNFSDVYLYYDRISNTPVTHFSYNYEEKVGNWGLGFTIGYQRTLWQVIFLEAFVGGGVQFASSSFSGVTDDDVYGDYETITDPPYRGILPKMGLQIGIGL